MSITKPVDQVTDADRPFICSRGNGDGTVTLYYDGDVVPQLPTPTPAEIAAILAAKQTALANATAARQYAKLAAMRTMTPAQLQVWIAANVTNLPQAQDALLTLAIGQCLLMNATGV